MGTGVEAARSAAYRWVVGLSVVYVCVFAAVVYLGFEVGTTLSVLGALTGISAALIGGYAHYVERVLGQDR